MEFDRRDRNSIIGWRETGAILEAERRQRLRALTPERAMFLTEALFSMPWPEEVIERRRGRSGLLEMQDLFRASRFR